MTVATGQLSAHRAWYLYQMKPQKVALLSGSGRKKSKEWSSAYFASGSNQLGRVLADAAQWANYWHQVTIECNQLERLIKQTPGTLSAGERLFFTYDHANIAEQQIPHETHWNMSLSTKNITIPF